MSQNESPKSRKVRGHLAKVQSGNDLAEVITQTTRLWRKAHLNYDQTKYVVEQVRRQLQSRSAPHAPA